MNDTPAAGPSPPLPRRAVGMLLASSAALAAVMIASGLLPMAALPTARVHPGASSLLQNTGGLAQQPEVIWLGYAMSLLILAVMASCAWIGLRKRDSGTPLSRWLMIGFAGYALVFTGMIITYARYTGSTEVPFLAGFPLPTAWMIFGVWHFPVAFVVLYMAMFDRWVLTAADMARFQELVDKNRRQGGTT